MSLCCVVFACVLHANPPSPSAQDVSLSLPPLLLLHQDRQTDRQTQKKGVLPPLSLSNQTKILPTLASSPSAPNCGPPNRDTVLCGAVRCDAVPAPNQATQAAQCPPSPLSPSDPPIPIGPRIAKPRLLFAPPAARISISLLLYLF
jgi:hypothetical protein